MADRTRRDVLAAGVGALGACALGSGAVGTVRADAPRVSVATRNCYLGADLFRLLAAATVGEGSVRDAIGELVAAVDRSHVERRLDAVAAELGRTEPDLVGIQEAALLRTGPPSEGTTPTATDVRYDFRELLVSALDERDLPYRVVAAAETTDVQLPGRVDGERRDVRLTDRDLILAREGVTTTEPVTDTFDAAFSVTQNERTLTVERAYGIVDATVGDGRLTFCNTHLEAASAETRAEQAAELRAALGDVRDPVVLVGDLNDGPGGSDGAYARLTETFTDVAGGSGPTCCHAADLRNPEPSLGSRIDHVLVRGELRATGVTRVGVDPAERIAVDGDRLWPADHAGVVATLAPGTQAASATTEPATATTSAPATTTPMDAATGATTAETDATGTDPDADSATTAPGFGAATALGSLVAAALAARSRSAE
ncbi:endonuclease/exonuclease/phosphatase family protein [Halorarum halobium]|uniref:endonuclease/exonuclease/phosphatase family protein n=1 Tax=Halorarum halobium TaxID=3075121 RepID=UPI0028B0F383|nr:endonuclease/exonuclease/phosphatase family protein [Halobaculum sp. XH14]